MLIRLAVILLIMTLCLLVPGGSEDSLESREDSMTDDGLDTALVSETDDSLDSDLFPETDGSLDSDLFSETDDSLDLVSEILEEEIQVDDVDEEFLNADEDDSKDEDSEEDDEEGNMGVAGNDDNDSGVNDDESVIESEEGNIMDEVTRRKRSLTTNEVFLSSPHHPLGVILVDPYISNNEGRRMKRTSYKLKRLMWPHHIPYLFADDFKDSQRKHRLRKVLDQIEDSLCVKFTYEGNRYNPSNGNWFKENGYKTNAYILFETKSGCKAVYGRGTLDRGPRKVKPCFDYVTMMHEVMHSLGAIHTQKMPKVEKYITVHKTNVYSRGQAQYKPVAARGQVNFGLFDPSSNLIYGPNFLSSNGLPTYSFVRPEMAQLTGMRSIKTLLYELNQNYKCASTFCSGAKVDCRSGYLTFVRNKCVCVCPDRYDPDTNCATLIEKDDSPVSWPNTPFSLFKANDCPKGTSSGTIPIASKTVPEQSGISFPAVAKTLNLEVCTKTSPSQNITWDEWPIGSYCFGKISGIPCSLPFVQSSFSMKTTNPSVLSGLVGDVTVSGTKLTINFCCYDNGPIRLPIKLPTSKPFRLLMGKGGCQEVEGMWAVNSIIKTQTKTTVKGYKPYFKKYRNYFTHGYCNYIPAIYGCDAIFTLNATHPTVTFSLPKKGLLREKNRRCFYAFKAPENSRLRLTFNKFSIHPKDRFYVKRFHAWTNHHRISSHIKPGQIITENNYLFVESWSYHEEDSKYEGADITVDLLFDEDMCYTVKNQGADYAGNKAVSETYEECVDWKDATSCPDFPWSYALQLLNSGNTCRNKDNKGMLQPWCYTYVKGEMCVRRYCDVCNEANPTDLVPGCLEKKEENPNLCSDTFRKNSCFKSCKQPTHPFNKQQVKCPRPDIPSDILTQESLLDSHNVGMSVDLSCNGQTSQIKCTTHGWTYFDQKCTGNLCIDASQLCQNALSKFPQFCTHEKSQATAAKYCKKSCGLCNSGTCTISGSLTYSLKSTSSNVSTGHTASFECNKGLHLLSGDLTRACSLSGKLLGNEPVCQETLLPVDINMQGIYNRYGYKTKLVGKMAALLLSNELRIPFDGKITKWYYLCQNNEIIYMLVYRKTGKGNSFQQVGSNMVKCEKNRKWTFDVPMISQVHVKKGDLIGVYQQHTSLAHDVCNGNKAPVAVFSNIASANDLLDLATKRFPKRMCLHISIGARVEP